MVNGRQVMVWSFCAKLAQYALAFDVIQVLDGS